VSARPRGVTFDLDGTLYRARDVHVRFLLRNLLFARTIRVARAVRDELRAVELDDGAHFAREEAARVAERLDSDAATVRARLDRLFNEALCRSLAAVGPRPDARAALQSLVDAGLSIAVVSDYRVPEKLHALGLDDLPWSALVAGEEEGALKPWPRAFLRAAERMGLAPDAIVHVGDRADTDGEGARRAGMECLLVDDKRTLREIARALLDRT